MYGTSLPPVHPSSLLCSVGGFWEVVIFPNERAQQHLTRARSRIILGVLYGDVFLNHRYSRADGMKYEGQFADGQVRGLGLLTFADGEVSPQELP